MPFGRIAGSRTVEGEKKIFIGREGERALLIDHLCSGNARGAFLITGRRGVGKTSFVEACLEEYTNSLQKRFLRSAHGRRVSDKLMTVFLGILIILFLLTASSLLGLVTHSANTNALLYLAVLPLIVVCLLPLLHALNSMRALVKLFLPKGRLHSTIALLFIVAFFCLACVQQPYGSPALSASRFLLAITFIAFIGRAGIPYLSAFQHPLKWQHWLFVCLVHICIVFFILNGSIPNLLNTHIYFQILEFPDNYLKDSDNLSMREIFNNLAWAVLLFITSIAMVAMHSITSSLARTNGQFPKGPRLALVSAAIVSIFLIWVGDYWLFKGFKITVNNTAIIAAIAMVVILSLYVLTLHNKYSLFETADEELWLQQKYKRTPPFEVLVLIKVLLFALVSWQLLYPSVNLAPEFYSNLIDNQADSYVPPKKEFIQNGVPLAGCYGFDVDYRQCNSVTSSGDVTNFSLFDAIYEEHLWLLLLGLCLVVIFMTEYDWINRGQMAERESAVLGVAPRNPDLLFSHHYPRKWPGFIDEEKKRLAPTIESFRILERSTLPWLLIYSWMPTIIARVNLGFDTLTHRGVTHAMLTALRREYSKAFQSWQSIYALLFNFTKMVIIIFMVSAISYTYIDFPTFNFNANATNYPLALQQDLTVVDKLERGSLEDDLNYSVITKRIYQEIDYCAELLGWRSVNIIDHDQWLKQRSTAPWPAYFCSAFPDFTNSLLPILFTPVIAIDIEQNLSEFLRERIVKEDKNQFLLTIFLHFNNGLPFRTEEGGTLQLKTQESFSFRIYHLLLFFGLLVLGQWLSSSLQLLPHSRSLMRLDNLLGQLTGKRSERHSRPLWPGLRYVRNLFKEEVDWSLEQDTQHPSHIELGFMEVLEEIRRSQLGVLGNFGVAISLPTPEITFVFDELDKITGNIGSENSESMPELENSLLHAELRRAYALQALLSDMKLVISTAPARFIFIGNRLLHDEWIADQSRRQPLLNSVFDGEIYLRSLLIDASSVAKRNSKAEFHSHPVSSESFKFSDRIYEFFWQRYKLANRNYGRFRFDQLMPFASLSQHGESSTMYQVDLLEENPTELIYRHEGQSWHSQVRLWDMAREEWVLSEKQDWLANKVNLGGFHFMISSFIHFLAYRSVGDPKRLQELIASHARALDRFSTDDIKLSQRKQFSCRDVLYFNESSLYHIQLINYVYHRLTERFESRLTNRDDKVGVSMIFIIDFLLKFHDRALSWENLQRVDELVHIHRAVDLRHLLEQLLGDNTEVILQPILNGMYTFRFHSDFSAELRYLSSISQPEMTAFNFTLDETQGLKAAYTEHLCSEQNEDSDKIAVLAELHEYDKQFDEARAQLRKAIDVLDKRFFERVGATVSEHDPVNDYAKRAVGGRQSYAYSPHRDYKIASILAMQSGAIPSLRAVFAQEPSAKSIASLYLPWGVRRLRLMLQVGLTSELIRDYERAQLYYLDARQFAWGLINSLELEKIENWYGTDFFRQEIHKDFLRHINLLYQPIFAEAWVLEKNTGHIDTAATMVESELIWLRKKLPFLNKADAATKNKNKTSKSYLDEETGKVDNFAGAGGSNFALVGAELHNKAASFYFFKGKQHIEAKNLAIHLAVVNNHTKDTDNPVLRLSKLKKRLNDPLLTGSEGTLFRAYYHNTVALHELRRFITYRRVTSPAKFNYGRCGNDGEQDYSWFIFTLDSWPLFVRQMVSSALAQLADSTLARLLESNIFFDAMYGKSLELVEISGINFSSIDSHYDIRGTSKGFAAAIVRWLNFYDEDVNFFEKNNKLRDKKTSDLVLTAKISNAGADDLSEQLEAVKRFLGFWENGQSCLDDKYPLLNKFRADGTDDLYKLIIVINLKLVAADLADRNGYRNEAIHQWLNVIDLVEILLRYITIILWLRDVQGISEITSGQAQILSGIFNPEKRFGEYESIKKQNAYPNCPRFDIFRKDFNRINSAITKATVYNNIKLITLTLYLAEVACFARGKYKNVSMQVWRRRPPKLSGRYLIGNAVRPEAVVLFAGICLHLQFIRGYLTALHPRPAGLYKIDYYSRLLLGEQGKDIKGNSKLSDLTWDVEGNNWFGDSYNYATCEYARKYVDNVTDSIESKAVSQIWYVLDLHKFPVQMQLKGIKHLLDYGCLCSDNCSGPRISLANLINWENELRMISESYDSPLHFSPYNHGESATLLALRMAQLDRDGKLSDPDKTQMQRILRRAIEQLDKSRELYTMGNNYYEAISDMYYLYDDFNDRSIHFNYAIQMMSADMLAILLAAVSGPD